MHEYFIGYHEQQRSKRRKIHVPKISYLLTTGGTEMLVRKRWITPIGEAHFDLLASANSLLSSRDVSISEGAKAARRPRTKHFVLATRQFFCYLVAVQADSYWTNVTATVFGGFQVCMSTWAHEHVLACEWVMGEDGIAKWINLSIGLSMWFNARVDKHVCNIVMLQLPHCVHSPFGNSSDDSFLAVLGLSGATGCSFSFPLDWELVRQMSKELWVFFMNP